ncbi:unnamed protein product [Oikopleura dioica]|uniref:Rhodanese domain-containing protein n=1 Tax=Oikopleura dioica TaxID=34765 RepID=E4WV62_OIKDI|nr:unnamed protein product [Oikopleura dioica]CBY33121.1 unnamed protein product [Oikopleura dioica]
MLRVLRPTFLRRALTNIDKAEFVQLSADPNVVVIDVRDINEVKGGTIPAANWNHIALDEFPDLEGLNDKNFELLFDFPKPKNDQKVVFYCMSGRRSHRAANMWETFYKSDNGYNYTGGWKEWNESWGEPEWKKWSQATGFPLA